MLKKPCIPFICTAAAIVLFFVPHPSSACTCVLPPSATIAMNKADLVFAGEVTHVEYVEKNDPLREPKIKVEFDLTESWKRPAEKKMLLTTVFNTWTCGGYPFYEGEKYLVYAYYKPEEKTWDTNVCSRTALLTNARADLEELGPGFPPQEAFVQKSTKPMSNNENTILYYAINSMFIVISLLGIILVLVEMYILIKRKWGLRQNTKNTKK